MTELLSLPDLPVGQASFAQMLVAVPVGGSAAPYKVAWGSILTIASAAGTYAPLASPTLTGVPTAPTAQPGNVSGQIATTAFVNQSVVSKFSRVITTEGEVSITPEDGAIFINKLVGSPTAISLYKSPALGATHVIKDARGDAAINNISVSSSSATIDGQTSFVLRINYAAICLIFNGTEWSVL